MYIGYRIYGHPYDVDILSIDTLLVQHRDWNPGALTCETPVSVTLTTEQRIRLE